MRNAPHVLEAARQHADLSYIDLWFAYFALGGNSSRAELVRWFSGASEPDRREHDIVVHALNERFGDIGYAPPLGYADDPDTLQPGMS